MSTTYLNLHLLLSRMVPAFGTLIFGLSMLCLTGEACPTSSTSSNAVFYDSGYTAENSNGTSLVVDKSAGHVYVVTSYPVVVKMDLDGTVVGSIALDSSWLAYGIELSSDSSKIAVAGDAGTAAIAVISTSDLSVLFSQKLVEVSNLRDVISNGGSNWYAIGSYE